MISIVLCTYNDNHFLSTAIPSCLRQDIEKEIILVDDGSSTPITNHVTDLIKHNNIKYIKHTTNSGLSAARNTGIAAAKYNLVIPLDADDWFYPNTLPILAQNIGDSDVVYGNVTDSGNLCYPIRDPLTRGHFMQDNPLFCSSLFKKHMWSHVGGYMVRKGPHYEDWNFWCRCFKHGFKFKYHDVTVYNHTSRPDSMLRQLHPNRDYYIKVATEGLN